MPKIMDDFVSASSTHIGIVMLGGLNDGVGNAVSDGFRANGYVVTPLTVDNEWPDMMDLIVIPGPMQPLAPLASRLYRKCLPPIVLWYTEQIPNPNYPARVIAKLADLRWEMSWWLQKAKDRWAFADRRLGWIDRRGGRLRLAGEVRYLYNTKQLRAIAVFTSSNESFFQRWHLPVLQVPMGFHSSFGRRLGCPRDIDVAFLGSTRDARRHRIIEQLAAKLSKQSIHFVIKDGSPERGSVHGEERVEFLNRTKIMLNVMRQPWDDPVFRILLAAPNGAMVLSEQVFDEAPFRPGFHFAVAQVQDLVGSIQHYLQCEKERSEIAERAYHFVTEHLTMEAMVSQLMNKLRTMS